MEFSSQPGKIVRGDFAGEARDEPRLPPLSLSPHQREAAQSRREAAERLTEDLGIIFWAIDRENRITYHNRAWAEFYERNGPVDWPSLPSAGDQVASPGLTEGATFWTPACDALRAGESTCWEEILPCHAPNQNRWMLERIQRLGDELVFSLYFLPAYEDAQPGRTHLRCLFTLEEKDTGWTLGNGEPRQKYVLGLSPECSLQVYQWLREG